MPASEGVAENFFSEVHENPKIPVPIPLGDNRLTTVTEWKLFLATIVQGSSSIRQSHFEWMAVFVFWNIQVCCCECAGSEIYVFIKQH